MHMLESIVSAVRDLVFLDFMTRKKLTRRLTPPRDISYVASWSSKIRYLDETEELEPLIPFEPTGLDGKNIHYSPSILHA
jgi:hypothetical protein